MFWTNGRMSLFAAVVAAMLTAVPGPRNETRTRRTIPIRGRRWRILGIPGAILVAMMVLAVGPGSDIQGVWAQDGNGTERHPAHFHKGTCDNLDPAPLFPLNDVAMGGMTGGTPGAASTPMAMGETRGTTSAIAVETSVTTVDASLDDLLAKPHAINIHESMANIGTYIACGDIGGMEQAGALVVGLRELNGSGHSGVAVLEGKGDQTHVSVYLAKGLSGRAGSAAGGTPAASGAGATAAKTAVGIKNFAYSPASVEIPVGGTITWTNEDTVPHTATAKERAVLQSGTIKPGTSSSRTFDKAGTYDYFCEFHANMKGTIVVG